MILQTFYTPINVVCASKLWYNEGFTLRVILSTQFTNLALKADTSRKLSYGGR